MNPEGHKNTPTPDDAHGEKIDRRKFLRLLGGAAMTAAVAGIPEIARSTEETQESVEGINTIEDAIRHYEKTGEIPNPEILFKHMQRTESQYYSEALNDELSPEFLEQFAEQVSANIRDVYESITDENEPPPMRLRQAIEIYLDGQLENREGLEEYMLEHDIAPPINHRSTVYNSNAISINDVLVNGSLQCRSGSHFFNQMATEILPREELDKLVLIYTEGHVLPGYETAEGEYIGLEMTSNVAEPPIFRKGNASEVGSFRVVRALNATLENIAGKAIHPDKTLLLEEDDETVEGTSEERGGRPRGGTLQLVSPDEAWADETSDIPRELYSFGSAYAPLIDMERPDLEKIVYKQVGPYPTLPSLSEFREKWAGPSVGTQ